MCHKIGPGPAAYRLPTSTGYCRHDIRKQRAAAYSFGDYHKKFDQNVGPGPGRYFLADLTRHGNNGSPQYTMRAITKLQERSRGPGPASHDVHKKPIFKGTNPPSYSMKSRNYAGGGKVVSPAPNTYMADIIKIRAPAYTMRPCNRKNPTCRSPGPAAYGSSKLEIKLKKAPQYTMAGRNTFQMKKCSPGPNTYNISSYTPGPKRPAYSFGIKHGCHDRPVILPCDNL